MHILQLRLRNEVKITKKMYDAHQQKLCVNDQNFFIVIYGWRGSTLKKSRKYAIAVLCILHCKMQKRFLLKRCENNISILVQLCKGSGIVN